MTPRSTIENKAMPVKSGVFLRFTHGTVPVQADEDGTE
jgi:hypothetical protein